MMERCQKDGSWDGYPGGDAPGFAFETLELVKDTELAALASDTWGCEVRPNETEEGINQPWHWITIPIMGMTMGEIFELKELAEDCAADKVYEFLFVAPAIPITGGGRLAGQSAGDQVTGEAVDPGTGAKPIRVPAAQRGSMPGPDPGIRPLRGTLAAGWSARILRSGRRRPSRRMGCASGSGPSFETPAAADAWRAPQDEVGICRIQHFAQQKELIPARSGALILSAASLIEGVVLSGVR